MTIRLVRLCAAVLGAVAIACGGSPVAPPPVAEGPAVHSIAPNIGTAAGGTEVTIRGLRFSAGATVTIGGRAATDVTVQGTDTIIARTPAAPAAGAADVVVSVGGRSGFLTGGFTYEIPPNNAAPVIASISAQSSRQGQPSNFADVGESITVTASVSDAETPTAQLEYRWTATLGTFSGTGATVTWQAPTSVSETPVQVTITLRVVERFGTGGIFQNEVSGTRVVRLHDSVREVGDMARRFLTEFSKPQSNQDVQDIMRDFNAAACPDPGDVEAERGDVIRHYTNFVMARYEIGTASVQVRFSGSCFAGRRGDACIAVPVFWDSTDKTTNVSSSTSGIDHLTGVYAATASRWWLCSSNFEPTGTAGHAFYSSRR